jgi:hypothetical protein
MRDRNRDKERKRFQLAKFLLQLAAYEAAREAPSSAISSSCPRTRAR